eukprot:PITA_25078
MKSEKKVTIKEEASTSYVKPDNLLQKIDKMFDRFTIADKPETPIRNLNFRGQQQPQFRIKQMEQKAQDQLAQQQQLKDNIIPKGLITLEELFDQDDVARKPSLVPTDKSVEDVNLGTIDKPKFVKLSQTLSPEVKTKYVRLLSEFSDVFAWDYSDLKVYDKDIIQHTIPIKPNQKLFRQKLRRINPKLMPSIELFKASIIVPIIFSDWILNLVPIRKKTREIRLCVNS